MRTRLTVGLVFLLVVAACGGSDSASTTVPATPTTVSTTTTAASTTGSTAAQDLDKLFDEGVALSDAGQFEEALVIFDELIAAYANSTSANLALVYVNRGNVHDNLGDFDLALADYAEALGLRPGFVPALANRGVAYSLRGEYELAIADLDTAIELDPSDAFARFSRGNVYRKMGEFDQALADYTRAIELEPNASAYFQRGRVYTEIGEFGLALSDFDDAIGLDQTNAAIYRARGFVFFELKEPELAIDDFSVVIDFDPNDAASHLLRGWSYTLLGDILNARIDLENAVALTDDANLITQAEALLDVVRPDYAATLSMLLDPDDVGTEYSDFVEILESLTGLELSPTTELSGVRRPGRQGGYGRYFFPELFLQPQSDQVPLVVFSQVWLYQDTTSASQAVDIELENSFDTTLRWGPNLPQDPDWGLATAVLANLGPVEFELENIGERGGGVYLTVEVFDLPESAVPPGPMFTVVAVFHRGPFLAIVGSIGQDLDLAQRETVRLARIVDERIQTAPEYERLSGTDS